MPVYLAGKLIHGAGATPPKPEVLPNCIVFYGSSGQFYKCTDNATWQAGTINVFTGGTTIQSAVRTSTGRILAVNSVCLFKSDDEGATWSQAILTGPGGFGASPQILSIVKNPEIIFALSGVGGTCRRSTDNGDTWTTVTGIPSTDVTNVFRTPTAIVCGALGNSSTIYTSSDEGASFVASSALSANTLKRCAAGNPALNRGVLVGMVNATTPVTHRFWYTNGSVWTQADTSAIDASSETIWNYVVYGKDRYIALPANRNFLAMSANEGATWTTSAQPAGVTSFSYADYSTIDDMFIVVRYASHTSALISRDGITWVNAPAYPSAIAAYSVVTLG